MIPRSVPGLAVLLFPLLSLSGAPATAQEPPTPTPVSPGDPAEILRVEARCPTFSWAPSSQASAYELVVYEIAPDEVAEPVLRLSRRLAGAVGSWTPDLARCLDRGRRYAWSVRAVDSSSVSEWSQPQLFEVADLGEQELVGARALLERWHQAEAREDQEPPAPRRETPEAEPPSAEKTRRIATPGTVPNRLTVGGAVTAQLFNGSGSGLLNVDADTVDGLDANAFAPTSHSHDGSAISSGQIADARIPSSIARDNEVAASFLSLGGGALTGNLGIGTSATQAPLHIERVSIEIPSSYLDQDDLVIEDNDAVLGLYSSTQGTRGSALILGETADNSVITFGKWAMVRETLSGGNDLRFTFGNDANYFANPIRFEIGDDGALTGRGIAKAFGVIDDDGTVLAGQEFIDNVSLSNVTTTYSILLEDTSLADCETHPLLVSVQAASAIRAPVYQCPSGEILVRIKDSLGVNKKNQFSFVIF